MDPDLAETDQPYAYAGDDPVNEADPTGLATQFPYYCFWGEIRCLITPLRFADEPAYQEWMETSFPGVYSPFYRVYLPPNTSYPIA